MIYFPQRQRISWSWLRWVATWMSVSNLQEKWANNFLCAFFIRSCYSLFFPPLSKCPLKKWHYLEEVVRADLFRGRSKRTVVALQIHPTTRHQSALIWRWVGLCEENKYRKMANIEQISKGHLNVRSFATYCAS